jgi:hypothetical protein
MTDKQLPLSMVSDMHVCSDMAMTTEETSHKEEVKGQVAICAKKRQESSNDRLVVNALFLINPRFNSHCSTERGDETPVHRG